MKAKVKQIVEAYKLLGNSKVNTLDFDEKMKLVRARKAMRPIVDEYDAFLKDCQEKFKPGNWDEVQKNLQQWQQEGEKTTLTEEQRIEVNKAIINYQKSIDVATKDELEKEVEISIEQLNEGSDIKMMDENGWELKKLDEIEVIL